MSINELQHFFIFILLIIVCIISLGVFAYFIKVTCNMFLKLYGKFSNFILLTLGLLIMYVGFQAKLYNLQEGKVIILTIGSGLCGLAIRNLFKGEETIRTAGDWRKNLYKLEQRASYTINDLYELNSYINPYSSGNKTSIIINETIVYILNNHAIKKTPKKIFQNQTIKNLSNLYNLKYKKVAIFLLIITFFIIIIFYNSLFQNFLNIIKNIIINNFNHNIFCILYSFLTGNLILGNILGIINNNIINYIGHIKNVGISNIIAIIILLLSVIIYKKMTKNIINIDTEINNNEKDIILKSKMIRFLQTGQNYELTIKNRTNNTVFDFEVNNIEKTESLTAEETNLVRLACHVLLKSEWKEWSE